MTRFTFIQKKVPIPRSEQMPEDAELTKDASFPAGRDSPWRPGAVAGFHLNMDALGVWVVKDNGSGEIGAEVVRLIAATNQGSGEALCDALAYESGSPHWCQLVDAYHDYIVRYLPPKRGSAKKDIVNYPGLAADLEERANRASEKESDDRAETVSEVARQEHVVYIRTSREALWEALTSADITMKYHLLVGVESTFRKGRILRIAGLGSRP